MRGKSPMKRKGLALLLLLILFPALGLAGCGGSEGSAPGQTADQVQFNEVPEMESSYDYGGINDASFGSKADANDADVPAGDDAANPAGLELSKEKLVYSADISIETLEFEKSHEALLETIEQHDGIIQSQNFSDDTSLIYYQDDNYKRRSLSVTARIPSSNYTAFTAAAGNIGYIRNSHSKVDNISQRYYDTQTRLNSLRIQEERLLQMLKEASSVEAMIQVESRLSEVQYEIDTSTTELQYMDMDVSFSTVTIDLYEVHKYSNIPSHRLNFWERLSESVQNAAHSFVNVLEWLLTAVIFLLPYLVIAALLIYPVRRRRKRKQEHQDQ